MKEIVHDSDCAVNNEPAFPAGPCDCGAEATGTHFSVFTHCIPSGTDR